jgi:hypothetical protein
MQQPDNINPFPSMVHTASGILTGNEVSGFRNAARQYAMNHTGPVPASVANGAAVFEPGSRTGSLADGGNDNAFVSVAGSAQTSNARPTASSRGVANNVGNATTRNGNAGAIMR